MARPLWSGLFFCLFLGSVSTIMDRSCHGERTRLFFWCYRNYGEAKGVFRCHQDRNPDRAKDCETTNIIHEQFHNSCRPDELIHQNPRRRGR